MVKIIEVAPGGYADRAGIKPLDTLISINENKINDVLDYRFYLADTAVRLKCERSGEEYCVLIEKDEYEDIGLGFETPLMDKKHSCKNGCIFCFIDQNPKGMRESVYFKDDDSRLSFIHGNYVTLTNMTDEDVERIVKMRMSPINISIHTTNPELRVKMMKNKRSGEVLKYLEVFREAGLTMAGQIVLCKGVNDGDELMRTMRDLAEYYPSLSSVSVVPAGLTKHREGLYPLSPYTPEEAGEIIDAVEGFADTHNQKFGSRLFFLADEFYLKAGRKIPASEYYEGYPQLENGVGLLRSFEDGFEEGVISAFGKIKVKRPSHTVSVATGAASYPLIKRVCEKICDMYPKMKINVYKITNNFFGESITVSGLLTGRDIYEQLKDKQLGKRLLVPSAAIRQDEDVFLCDMTVSELSAKLGVKVIPTENDGYEFARTVLLGKRR